MVTAASKDFQANIMDYCDIAWGGEDVFIPRSGDKNVFIISERAYRQLQEARKTSEFLSGLTDDPSYHRNKEVLARSVEELRLD